MNRRSFREGRGPSLHARTTQYEVNLCFRPGDAEKHAPAAGDAIDASHIPVARLQFGRADSRCRNVPTTGPPMKSSTSRRWRSGASILPGCRSGTGCGAVAMTWSDIREEPLKKIDQTVELGHQHGMHQPAGSSSLRTSLPAPRPSGTERWPPVSIHGKAFAHRYKGDSQSPLKLDLINEPPMM